MTDAPGDRPPGEDDEQERPLLRRDRSRRSATGTPSGPVPQPPEQRAPSMSPVPPVIPAVPPRPPLPPSTAPEADGSTPTDPGQTSFQSHVRSARSDFEHTVAQARADFDAANEKIKQRTGRDLIRAILIGLAIGVVVLASLLFVKWLFTLIALAACLLGIFEFTRALQAAKRRIDIVPQLLVTAVVIIAGFFFEAWVHWVVVFASVALLIVWRLVGQMASRDGRTYGDILDDILAGVFAFLYVGFLGSLGVVLLREPGGQWWVLTSIVVVVVSDTAAYGAGVAFGRHPMAPRISPKKTWEGFAGAAIGVLVAGVLLAWLMLHLPVWTGIVIGIVILVTATLGDLGESMIKRDLGIKDMSSWLPGHGGVLDRLDSILPSGVAALALYILLSPMVVS